MVNAGFSFSKEQISEFCRENHIQKLSFFGSVLRSDFNPSSDIDILVEFDPGHTPGFIGLCEMEEKLSSLLGGRKLDMVTPKFLNHRIRNQVLADAETQYAKG